MERYTKSDRVERAMRLYAEAKTRQVVEGLWECKSSNGRFTYRVTLTSCTCPDSYTPCKHMLACGGIFVAASLYMMRRAGDVSEMKRIAASLGRQPLPELYLSFARSQYAACRDKLEYHHYASAAIQPVSYRQQMV